MTKSSANLKVNHEPEVRAQQQNDKPHIDDQQQQQQQRPPTIDNPPPPVPPKKSTNKKESKPRKTTDKQQHEDQSNKIFQLRKTIELQQEEIISLQQRIELQYPGLEVITEDMEPPGPMMSCFEDPMSKSLDYMGSSPCTPGLLSGAPSLGYVSLNSEYVNRKELELTEENEMLRAELQESKDHSELLEFRILEFTEGIQNVAIGNQPTVDQSTCTTGEEFQSDSGQSSPISSDDLSLPLSLDSGLDLNVENNSKARLREYRKSLEESLKNKDLETLSHLIQLFDQKIPPNNNNHYEKLLTSSNNNSMSPRYPFPKKMMEVLQQHSSPDQQEIRLQDSYDENIESGSDLAILAAKLQETLTNPEVQEEVLQETIIKLRSIDSSLSRLQSRVLCLTTENKDLQEALSSLHEAHETRTELSGTESELVNAKTPSLHSDLSDTDESDSSSSTSHPKGHHKFHSNTISFHESGIFESSCETLNASTQTNGESNEYIVASLEGEKVTLCKIEYDTIVSTERKLQREVELLQCEKQQLQETCSSLEKNLAKARKESFSDTAEVLRAELRLLDQRLTSTDRLKRQFFDEKCEIEEAENDARLMAQRLESQLEAAREMESLLSASLSQEQEFCRELQRRVREMQAIDKGRRLHEEALEQESYEYRMREAEIIEEADYQTSQLCFYLYGLLFSQYWRRIASINQDALVHRSVCENIESDNYYLLQTYCKLFNRPYCVAKKSLTDINDNQVSSSSSSDDYPSLSSSLSSSLKGRYDYFSSTKEVADTESQTDPDYSLTMTDDNPASTSSGSDPSERELFYLTQIENLQKDKRNMRGEQEAAENNSIQEMRNVKSNLEKLEDALESCQRDKCKLLFRLEESHQTLNETESNFDRYIKDLKKEFQTTVDLYKNEQIDIDHKYQERIVDLQKNAEIHEQRFSSLLQQYSILQHELTSYLNSNNMENSSSNDSGNSPAPSNHYRITTTKDLLSAVRDLVKSDQNAKQRNLELEKKESAYRETINEADRIMASHVTAYTSRIEELEANLDQRLQRINQLEKSEERLRSTMKTTWKSEEGARISELLDRLIVTENSELQLKERVWNLERNGKELEIKFVQAEKAQENLKGELRDQDELVQRLMSLQSENNALTSKLQEAHEAAKRAADLQQNESYLKGRIDELEASEMNLKDILEQNTQCFLQKERKLRDQVSNMEEEISTVQEKLEMRSAEVNRLREIETFLKQQVEEFKLQIQVLENDIRDSSSENKCYETQHRSEVTKLRSQLKLVNAQLTEFDEMNCQLKERMKGAENTMSEVALQLEERIRRHENEVLALNLEIGKKDSQLEEFQAAQTTHSHNIEDEFDLLNSSPLMHIQTTLQQFVEESNNCEKCCKGANLDLLNESLKVMIELMNGRNSQTCSDSEDMDSNSIENIRDIQCSLTSSPHHHRDNDRNTPKYSTTSGDEESTSVVSLPVVGNLTREKIPIAKSKSSELVVPSVPPRPRRDAKKKRKSSRRNNSLLQELEETSFYGRGLTPSPSVAFLEDLEEKVMELEEVIVQKEQELRIADLEASELSNKLVEEDRRFNLKQREVDSTNKALASLREQLLSTAAEYEKVRQTIEVQQKVDLKAMNEKIEVLTENLIKATEKCYLKDKIISLLVDQIRSILRSGGMSIAINQLKSSAKNNQNSQIQDFDFDSLYENMNEPFQEKCIPTPEEPKLTHRSVALGKIDSKKSPQTPKPKSPAPPPSETLIGVPLEPRPTPRNLPPITPQKQSRIPRLRPLSVPSLKHETCPYLPECKNPSSSYSFERLSYRPFTGAFKEVSQPKRPFTGSSLKEVSQKRPFTGSSVSSNADSSSSHHRSANDQSRRLTGKLLERRMRRKSIELKPLEIGSSERPLAKSRSCTAVGGSRPLSKSRSCNDVVPKPLAKIAPKQRPTAKVYPKPKISSSSSFDSPQRKVSLEDASPTHYISDARKVKRMVTGTAPLDAEVDCSSAPEYKKQEIVPYPTCVPRPSNLRITRRVGVDGAVIAWTPLDHDCVAGFQVIVGGRVVQLVRSPHRTKALVTGLPFHTPFTIALVTVADDGRCSTPTLFCHNKTEVYKPRLSSNTRRATPALMSPRKSAVPTCL